MHGKLKTWKEHIKTNLHGQDLPYKMYFNATAVSLGIETGWRVLSSGICWKV